MKRILALMLLCILIFVSGCAGGGGTPNVQITGLIAWLATGGPPAPLPTVQVSTTNTVTAAVDGTFAISAPRGTDHVTVIYQPSSGAPISFVFSFAPASADTDIGTVFIGPEKVNASGTIVDTVSSNPVSGAKVTLGGASGVSDSLGHFVVSGVAYDSTVPSAFFLLNGRVERTGYFPRLFNPQNAPVAGTSDLGTLTLQPNSGANPPPNPFTIFGTVLPTASSEGSIVTLTQGVTVIRRVTVGADHQYGFWVPPGTYTINASKPGTGLTAGPISVTLTSTSQTVRQDVTLQ